MHHLSYLTNSYIHHSLWLVIGNLKLLSLSGLQLCNFCTKFCENWFIHQKFYETCTDSMLNSSIYCLLVLLKQLLRILLLLSSDACFCLMVHLVNRCNLYPFYIKILRRIPSSNINGLGWGLLFGGWLSWLSFLWPVQRALAFTLKYVTMLYGLTWFGGRRVWLVQLHVCSQKVSL